MTVGRVFGVLCGGLVCLAAVASADSKVLKHDHFDGDISTAVAEMNGQTLQTEPGFVQYEAFGMVFRLDPKDLPLTIDGVDMVFAAPPNGSELTTDVTIEFFLDSGNGPKPTNETPTWSINTTEFFYNGEFGVPIKGGQAYQFDFDPSDPEGAPPQVTTGNVMVMVRFNKKGTDMQTEWGTIGCASEFAGFEIGCGCQPAGMILDGTPTKKDLTPNVNIINLVWPLGECSGSKEWKFFDNITLGTKKLNGDVVLRLRVTTSGTSCTGDCTGKACGDDGCGAVCGVCAGTEKCTAAQKCCAPLCDGKVCGDDGCGGKCGNCAAGLECTPLGQCQVPCVVNCTNRECGADGCGGTCGTGACGAGTTCDEIQGLCIAQCTASCAGKACGNDGCGGKCGECGDNEVCTNSYTCAPVQGGDGTDTSDATDGSDSTDGADGTDSVDGADGTDGAPVAVFSLAKMSPDEAEFGVETAVSITGAGFAPGLELNLGGTALLNVVYKAPGLANAVVPATLKAGRYDLIALNSNGETASLSNAFIVAEAAGGGGGGGCSTTPTSNLSLTGAIAMIALAFGAGLALRLKRLRRPARVPAKRVPLDALGHQIIDG